MNRPLIRSVRLRANSLLMTVIGLSWAFVYEDMFGDLAFGLFAGGCILVLLSGTWRFNRSNRLTRGLLAQVWQYFRHTWFLVLLSWLYGFMLGWCLGNPPVNVIRNFFGLTLYVFLPLFVAARMTTRQVVNLVTIGGIIQCLWGLYAIITSAVWDRSLEGNSVSDYRSIYSTGFIVIFPLFSLILALNAFPRLARSKAVPRYLRRWGRNPVVLVVISFFLIVPSMSKGFILTATMIGLFIAFTVLLGGFQRRRVRIVRLLGVLVAFPIGLAFLLNIQPLLLDSFSSREPSNMVRSEQAGFLVAEFQWWGNGLGARLKSGYARDEAGYGFELTYLNLVHKLGFAAAPIFLLYAGTVAFALRLTLSARARVEGIVALGAMGYLVVGAGNPVLLSVTAVSLHLLALVLIDNGVASLSSDRVKSGAYQRELVHA